MKNVLLFGAGKSATSLIEYLIAWAPKGRWQVTVVDADLLLARSKTGGVPFAQALSFDIRNDEARGRQIAEADVVISLLPAALHLAPEIEQAGILFMGEMGLDPGIDHMGAMSMLDSIRRKGGDILSFRGFCGALVTPASNDNPWQYKISWNPAAVVHAGKGGALYREKGRTVELPYERLFGAYRMVDVPRLGKVAYYPNRDSLQYASLYRIDEVPTILRATLRFPPFCEGWQALVSLGLTADTPPPPGRLSYRDWALQAVPGDHRDPAAALASFLQTEPESALMQQLAFLGLLSAEELPPGQPSNAAVLERLLAERLILQPEDHDMIVMMHEVAFRQHGIDTTVKSYLIVVGEDNLHTAIARTVGLPPGILARLLLADKVSLRGLHIPVAPEIYKPVLKELEEYGIRFEESFSP